MLTDNEIIKALECCVYRTCNECIRQPIEYGRTERDCKTGLMKNARSLINRQKAEIKRLQKYDEERDIRLHARLTEKARAEAIKEFAERLLGLYSTCTLADTICMDVLGCDIKRLVKEMVGDDK